MVSSPQPMEHRRVATRVAMTHVRWSPRGSLVAVALWHGSGCMLACLGVSVSRCLTVAGSADTRPDKTNL